MGEKNYAREILGKFHHLCRQLVEFGLEDGLVATASTLLADARPSQTEANASFLDEAEYPQTVPDLSTGHRVS